MTNNNSHIKTFNISSIGWIILIVGLIFSAGTGVAVGLILASINWLRLGKNKKAFGSLGIGIFFVILFSIITHVWKIQNPLPSTWQLILSIIIQGILILLSIAIVEKLLKNDFTQSQNDRLNFEAYSTGAIIGVTLIGLIITWILMGVVIYGVEVYLAPKVEVTSEFVSNGNQTVIGSISAWSKEPIANRQLVLCQLEKKPLAPYDCLVTHLTAMTDNNGEFQIKNVPAGKYLIIYDTGLTDFQKGLEIWQDKELRPGNLSWKINNNKELYTECGEDSYLIMPENRVTDFYYSKAEYVFTQCGSYFFLAHDISAALTYEEEDDDDYLKRLPSDVFKPVVVEVAPNNDSIVTFAVLSAPR